jgi:peptidoglycan/LPS O-acetylase OafA/YrhL
LRGVARLLHSHLLPGHLIAERHALTRIFDFASIAVIVFFAISGYPSRVASTAPESRPRRTLRILPAYVVATFYARS